MRKTRRLAALSLTAAVAVTLLAGCGGSKTSEETAGKADTTSAAQGEAVPF